jgi:hypothetical protein
VLRSLITGHGTIGRRRFRFEETHNFFSPLNLDGSGEMFRDSMPARNLHRRELVALTFRYQKNFGTVPAQHDEAISFALVLFCACQFATPNRAYLLELRDQLVLPEGHDEFAHVVLDNFAAGVEFLADHIHNVRLG